MKTKRYHVIIDVSGIKADIVNNQDGLKQFLNDLPGIINMHPLTDPMVVKGIPENPGLSGFVIIDYSHISIHTFSENNEALVDIFSCKPYEQEDAVQATLNYFQIPREQARIQEVCWN